MDCAAHAGLHIRENDLLLEVVDGAGRPVRLQNVLQSGPLDHRDLIHGPGDLFCDVQEPDLPLQEPGHRRLIGPV